jgi:Tol biopolymer transport system component
VSADGRILIDEGGADQDITELPLDGSSPRPILATSRNEYYPDWSPKGDQLVFVTDRNGAEEIWLMSQSGNWQRPLVTQDMFANRPVSLTAPVFSPDGRRIAFSGPGGIWIAPATGGTPSRAIDRGVYPTWSPDGQWLACTRTEEGKRFVQKFQIGSASPPIRIGQTGNMRPAWSPDGKWITVLLPEGLGLVSPDGKETKLLTHRIPTNTAAIGWARDGKTLFMADRIDEHMVLIALDVASSRERRIADYGVTSFNFGNNFIRSSGLSVSRDGRSLLANTLAYHAEIWMIEGLGPPRTFWQRFFQK